MRKHLVMLVLAACGPGGGSASGDPDAHTTHGDASTTTDAPLSPPGPRLIPGPNDSGYDDALGRKARAYDRQFHTFAAMPFGLSLDALIPDAADRAQVSAFLAQDTVDDFAAFSGGRTVKDIVVEYDEHGVLGMFAGAAAAGEAFRYMAIRDDGLDATQARTDLLEAIASFHVAATITGVPGTVARGVRKLDEPGTAPAVEAVPSSCPQAGDRGNRWRSDGSGQYPNWIYNDNNSKDQLIGYVFALGAFWDAVANDPAIAQTVKDQIQADARALAQSLMTPVQLGFSGSADLVIRDWNNCPTKHLDLNPRIVPIDGYDPLILAQSSTTQNGWNALAALGVVRTLYHIAGDTAIGAYYYGELVGARNFPQLAISGPARVRAMYQDSGNVDTNFSNVNMAFVAAYGLLRYESDPALRAKYESILATELWDAGHHHDAGSAQQAFFSLLQSGFRTRSEEHTSELQSPCNLVCRRLLA